MRVALACDWFLKYTAAQAAALARAGAEVVLLCRDHAVEFGGDRDEWHATVEEAGRKGVRVLATPGRLWDPRATSSLVRIRRSIGGFDPDVIHLHDHSVDPRGFALLPRAPAVLTVHDPALHPGHPVPRLAPRRWLLERSQRMWRARAEIVVVHSEQLRSQVALRADQRCVVVPHGLSALREPLPPPPAPTVGFFGRLQPYKGLEVLARAMPRVWSVRPEVQLRVVGSGTSELPLNDPRVTVQRSYLPESDVKGFFRGISLTVLPYTQASQTGAGSVAVGLGVPVVASRVGGLPDLVLDESYLCEPGDDGDLARAILLHLDDGADVRRRVLADVAAPHSWDALAARNLKLYGELLDHR
jgi:glycosyltransferase involved in cell wall biosynthesis